MKKCKYCKSEIDEKAKVCAKCGKSQSSKLLKVLIIFVIIIVCIVGCVSACSKGVSDAIDEATNDAKNLKLDGDVTTTKDDYGISYYIEGYIKNDSDKAFSYVQVTYTTYDENGNTLGTCLDNNSGLEANGRWKFKAICTADVSSISNYKLTEITGW